MSKPRWKREQEKKRKKIRKQIFVRGLTMLTMAFFLFLGFKIWQAFKNSLWDGKHEINFVVDAEDIFIFSFNPDNNLLNSLVIPGQSYLTLAKGYGEYKVKNIYQLGEMEKIDGGQLLLKSVQTFFAIPVDGWIKIKNFKQEKINLKKIFWLLFRGQVKTNLSWWDMARLFWLTKNLPIDQTNEVDLRYTNFIKKEPLPDGSQIFKFEQASVDEVTVKLFSDEKILKEDLQTVVLNATDHAGLAKKMARVVKNLGVELIGTKDHTAKFTHSAAYCQSEKSCNSYTLQRIGKNFDLEIKNEKIEDFQVDLVIVLGENFWQEYYSSN